MTAKILELKVADGESVQSRQMLIIMEAMKKEHRIVAPSDGMVSKDNLSAGDQVQQGEVLVEIVD